MDWIGSIDKFIYFYIYIKTYHPNNYEIPNSFSVLYNGIKQNNSSSIAHSDKYIIKA